MRTDYATSLLMVLVLSATAYAQKPGTLDQVDAQLKAGQLTQARATLAQWRKDHTKANASSEDGARANYLAARLTTNADDAEDAYLSVVISAPSSSPYIAESLLRVGQAEMAKGSPRNAIPYLQRLVENYPTSEFASEGKDWLARAQGSGAAVAPTKAATPAAPPVKPEVKPAAKPTAPATGARFAIQVAAFREKSNARGVARKISQAGFSDVRLVTIPENALVRVRVGKFANEAAASATLKKLKAAGYTPVVVSDATREQVVHE